MARLWHFSISRLHKDDRCNAINKSHCDSVRVYTVVQSRTDSRVYALVRNGYCNLYCILLNLSVTAKAAPRECVNRTGLLWTWVKPENEV